MRKYCFLLCLLFPLNAYADIPPEPASEPSSSEPSDDEEGDSGEESEDKGCSVVAGTASGMVFLSSLAIVGWRRKG